MDSTLGKSELVSRNFLERHPENNSLSPLPSNLRRGLISISVVSALSLTLSSILFLYLTYKFITWRLKTRERARIVARNIPEVPDIPNLDFDDRPFGPQGQSAKSTYEQNVRQIRNVKAESPNQFLVLIYHLLIADIHQAIGFLISVVWLGKDGIFINSTPCFVQALFLPNGDLAASCFITLIAIHTYMSIVRNYRPPQRVLYATIIFIWIFVWVVAAIPILATKNGEDVGGYFVRAGAWCWISKAYETLRLATHYIFIFLAIVITTVLYIAIYIAMRGKSEAATPQANHNPVFLIYPLIYVVCTLPLALGRVATMAGADIPIEYYCFAGTLMTANGLFDCILFSATRHSIVFGSADNIASLDTGLDTFSFMRTPASEFGNNIWIQGGSTKSRNSGVGGWWQSHMAGKNDLTQMKTGRSSSQTSLRASDTQDLGIQMNVVTTMTVEVDHDRTRGRYRNHTASGSPSVTSDDIPMHKTPRGL